jgi:hypothetical protein
MRRALTSGGLRVLGRWGYKILMLDVLFPLSVKKIVFVDADQIVRWFRWDSCSGVLASTREYGRVLRRSART